MQAFEDNIIEIDGRKHYSSKDIDGRYLLVCDSFSKHNSSHTKKAKYYYDFVDDETKNEFDFLLKKGAVSTLISQKEDFKHWVDMVTTGVEEFRDKTIRHYK